MSDLPSPTRRIVVIGGGVSGLAAAHRLVELGGERGLALDVRLLEAGARAGGAISTERRDGFVLEHGPDSMITDKPWGVALARRLGLDEALAGTQETHRRSFVVRNGKLLPVPEGFQLLAPSRFGPLVRTPIFSLPGKARMALDLLLPRRRAKGDESLGHFVRRRLGQEALDRMAQPMIAGIYGADPMALSLQATLPRFLDMERDHGSVIRGMWARMREGQAKAAGDGTAGVSGARYGLFVTFREGMQTLTDALLRALPPGCVSLGTRVERLTREEAGWRLELSGGGALSADAVLLALPAYRSGELLHSLDGDLARLLNGIPYASCATMSLCFRREEVPHPLDGFGFVVPSREGLSLLGCTFTHVKFANRAPEGVALLRAFVGEAALAGRDDRELERQVRADLRRLLDITAEPFSITTWRHARSMPQYAVGHLERVTEIERRAEALPGLALAGNAYRGVGIPDCVHSGEQAAEALLGPGG
jgi:oxygen-dependent protoporphyrinogen oxidase